jgi:FKBP-type peptidyl-prolyl cis-trans isomerase
MPPGRCLILFIVLIGCSPGRNAVKTSDSTRYITTASGLQYSILKKGDGPTAQAGQEILLFETTSYRNGTVLYSNENSSNPVKVLIGGNQATDAVDEGLRGMQAGEVRQLVAPPYLVKRKSYPSNVSPDSTLVIRLILHKIL